MVIVMRTDLGNSCGKMIAQAGHAIVGVLDGKKKDKEWYETGMKKVALAVDSEAALLQYHVDAQIANIPSHLIIDAGLTQNEPGTYTCCAIGPASEQQLKKITGSLKLL